MSNPAPPVPAPQLDTYAVLIVRVGEKTMMIKDINGGLHLYVFGCNVQGMPPSVMLCEHLAKLLMRPIEGLREKLQFGLINVSSDPRRYFHMFSMEMTREEVQGFADAGLPIALVKIPEEGDAPSINPVHMDFYFGHKHEAPASTTPAAG